MDSEWPLREFVKFAPKIFASRGFDGALSKIRFRSKYHTRPLQDAMKSIFREKSMWGGLVGKSTSPNTKVALVSIDNKTQKPVVLSNYNRRGDYSSFYEFERPSRPEQELKIWEAAVATSAIPTFFKPFSGSQRDYISGSLSHNCPAHIALSESKLIWQELDIQQPDVFLSLGTGRYERYNTLQE